MREEEGEKVEGEEAYKVHKFYLKILIQKITLYGSVELSQNNTMSSVCLSKRRQSRRQLSVPPLPFSSLFCVKSRRK